MKTYSLLVAFAALMSVTAFAEAPRDCSSILPAILKLNGVNELPVISGVENINQTLKEIQEAKNTIAVKERAFGGEPDPAVYPKTDEGNEKLLEAQRKFTAEMRPYYDHLTKVEHPFESDETMMMIDDHHLYDARMFYTYIENHGQPSRATRIFVKRTENGERIAGVQIVRDDKHRTYVLNRDCTVKGIRIGSARTDNFKEVSPQICMQLPQMKEKFASLTSDRQPPQYQELLQDQTDLCRENEAILSPKASVSKEGPTNSRITR